VTTTLILVVVRAGNVNLFQTRLVAARFAPGMVAHAVPVQYSARRLVTPYFVKVIASVGSVGEVKAS
jgi:hypothetical protein